MLYSWMGRVQLRFLVGLALKVIIIDLRNVSYGSGGYLMTRIHTFAENELESPIASSLIQPKQ